MNVWFKRYGYALIAITVVTILVAPAPQPSPARTAGTDEGWAMPKVAPMPANFAAAVRELSQSKLWGGQADPQTQSDDRALKWRIAGVTGQQKDRYVIVQFGDDRILQLKAKEQFPDGTVIAEVRENGVCVILQGKRRLLPLDGQAPAIIW